MSTLREIMREAQLTYGRIDGPYWNPSGAIDSLCKQKSPDNQQLLSGQDLITISKSTKGQTNEQA